MISERHAVHFYALMRIVFGFLFIFHGLQKIFGLFGGRTAELLSLRGLAGAIEIVAGALIMLGLYTRPAAFIASGQMAAAYFMSHQPAGLWPIQNRGELAALYCFGFLYIAARGKGAWGLDRK
jgi:putative oxidoreductase